MLLLVWTLLELDGGEPTGTGTGSWLDIHVQNPAPGAEGE